MSEVRISIDSLMLNGVPAEQQAAVIAAFETELGRALAAGRTIAPGGGAGSAAAGVSVAAAPNAGPQAIGRAMAQALTRGRTA